MSKGKKITCLILAITFVILSSVVLFWYFGDNYYQFYSTASKEFEIAGLNEGFVPQGMCYDRNSNNFITCGYMKNGEASRIYVVNAQTGKTEKYFVLKYQDDSLYNGHAGGITTSNEYIWIVGDSKVCYFKRREILTVKNGEAIDIVNSFETKNGADFVTIKENTLFVGEFHREGKYDTPENHTITISETETNKAITFCYDISQILSETLEDLTPTMAISTTSLVQGMAITDDKIILSTSYSLPNSHILTYNNVLSNTPDSFDYNGTNIPLYILSKNELQSDLEAPCMSEEIVYVNNRLYILFESACQKYNFITREPLRYVYSIPA